MKKTHLGLLALGAFVGYKLISKAGAKVASVATPMHLSDDPSKYHSDGIGCTPTMLGCLADIGCTLGDAVESLGCDQGVGSYYGSTGDDGLGFSLKRAVSKVIAPVRRLAAPVTTALKRVEAPVVKQIKRDIASAKKVTKFVSKDLIRKAKKPFTVQIHALQKLVPHHGGGGGGPTDGSAPPVAQAPGAPADNTVYEDANGNPITKDQYDALVNQANTAENGDASSFAPGDTTGQDVPVEDLQSNAANADQMTADDTLQQLTADDGSAYSDGIDTSADQANIGPSLDTSESGYVDTTGAAVPVSQLVAATADTSVYNDGDQGGEEDFSGENYNIASNFGAPIDTSYGAGDDFVPADETYPTDMPEDAFVAEGLPGNGFSYGGGTLIDPTASDTSDSFGNNYVRWDGGGSLGDLVNKQTGRKMYVVKQRPGHTPEYTPIKANGRGELFAYNGASLHHLGCLDGLCGIEGLGFSLFGRTYGQVRKNVDTIAKDIASKVSPSAALYKYVKYKHPTVFKKYRKEQHYAAPYEAIVGGTALSVVTLGAGSAAGAVAIAGGVAELAAQGYTDKLKHNAPTDSPLSAEYDPAAVAQSDNATAAQDEAMLSAGRSAVSSDQVSYDPSKPTTTGETDDDSLLTIGEQLWDAVV